MIRFSENCRGALLVMWCPDQLYEQRPDKAFLQKGSTKPPAQADGFLLR
jgi:hypothetical protein